MIRLLERAASATPEQIAVTTDQGARSYASLLDDAHRVAAALTARGIETAAVVEPDVGRVIALLAGAAIAGVEPCQYQADIDPAEFAAQASALGHDHVITDRGDLGPATATITPESLLEADPSPANPAGDGAQPLLIQTTGTTGAPKAARHDWRILARAVERVEPRPGQRWLLAYGPHQFAGVQVLLHVLACGGTLVAPFPRRPRDGLDAIVGESVECVSATPTYWRFLLAEARARRSVLPDLTQITMGGEAIPSDLLDELRTTFPGARISQVYASTEFGSVTSVTDGRPGIAVAALFGDENPDADLRVVDGELWVRARSGMLGYVGDAPAVEAGEWRPTGDLVEIVGDRVEFRGRASEVINVGGVKVHPLPVENRIAALDEVALTRVYGRPNRLTGAIVAADIVVQDGIDQDGLDLVRASVVDAVADLPRAWRPRSINFVDDIETRGSKTVRGMER